MKNNALLLWSFLVFSCSSGSVPKNILSENRMEKIVYELMQVDEYMSSFVIKDSTADIKKKRSLFYEQVFSMNQTSKKEFYSSYKYYQQHPNLQKSLFDTLLAKATRSKSVRPTETPLRLTGKEKIIP